MSNIDKQTVQAVADLKVGYTLGHADVEIIQQMALDAVTLLDELEAADALNKHLELAIRKAEGCSEKLREKAEAAEKRIAELEARDKPKFVQCWSCKHCIEILAIADSDGYCPRCAAPIDLDDEPYIGTAAAGKGE